jgi:hypothetical protein
LLFVEFYISAPLPPTQSRSAGGVNEGFKRCRIQGSYLPEIDNAEFYFTAPIVADGEIEPLNVPSSIAVYPHKEIVLIWTYFDNCIEVTTLKVAVKSGLFVMPKRRIHTNKQSIMFRFEMSVEFPEVGCEYGELRSKGLFVLVKVLSLHF